MMDDETLIHPSYNKYIIEKPFVSQIIVFSSIDGIKKHIQCSYYMRHYIISRILQLRRYEIFMHKPCVYGVIESYDSTCVKYYKDPKFKNISDLSPINSVRSIFDTIHDNITKVTHKPVNRLNRNVLFFCFPVKVLNCKVYNENHLVRFQFFPIDEYFDLNVYCISLLGHVKNAKDVKEYMLMPSEELHSFHRGQSIDKIEILASLGTSKPYLEIYEMK